MKTEFLLSSIDNLLRAIVDITIIDLSQHNALLNSTQAVCAKSTINKFFVDNDFLDQLMQYREKS